MTYDDAIQFLIGMIPPECGPEIKEQILESKAHAVARAKEVFDMQLKLLTSDAKEMRALDYDAKQFYRLYTKETGESPLISHGERLEQLIRTTTVLNLILAERVKDAIKKQAALDKKIANNDSVDGYTTDEARAEMEREWFRTPGQQAGKDSVDGYTTDEAREEMEREWFSTPRQQAGKDSVDDGYTTDEAREEMEREWFSTPGQQAGKDSVDGYTTDEAREEMEFHWFGIPRQQAAEQPKQPERPVQPKQRKQRKQRKSMTRFQARAAGAKKYGAYKPRR